MTIAIFSGNYLDFGGVETHIYSIFEWGEKTGKSFILIGHFSEDFAIRIRSVGGKTIHWKLDKQRFLSSCRQLLLVLQAYDVRLLHIHGHRGSIIGRSACWYSKIPVILTIHLSLLDHFKDSKGIFRKIKTLLAIFADAILNYLITSKIIFVSEQAQNKSISLKLVPRTKCIVIKNGIDLTPFSNFEKNRVKSNLLSLIFVGRLHHQKGLDTLFHALSQLEDMEYELKIVGDGPDKVHLQNLANNLNLTNVKFLGQRSDITKNLAASNLFVLPSRFEAMPIALIEALAAGLPCVVTDVGENAAILDHQRCGLVVPPEDPASLAKAIFRLKMDPILMESMSENALNRAKEFSIESMLEKLDHNYSQFSHSV